VQLLEHEIVDCVTTSDVDAFKLVVKLYIWGIVREMQTGFQVSVEVIHMGHSEREICKLNILLLLFNSEALSGDLGISKIYCLSIL